MKTLTAQQLKQIYPAASQANIDRYLPWINRFMAEYRVDTPLRQAAFLGQIGHESAQLRYVEELASGQDYEGRKDLGNTEPGDGVRFKGRGLIQITGRANYAALGENFQVDFIANPAMLKEPEWAVRSAFWFWDQKGLNSFADAGDYITITRRINGGTNGLADRQNLYNNAKMVLQ